MKVVRKHAGKAFADGYAKGREERAEEIRKLKDALTKALQENIALREAATSSR